MLTDKDLGIPKFIPDRITQIDNEIVQNDPEYKVAGPIHPFLLIIGVFPVVKPCN